MHLDRHGSDQIIKGDPTMTAPRRIQELDGRGPFTGIGPHAVPTYYASPSNALFTIRCAWIIKNAAATEILFVGRCDVTKHDATGVVITNFVQVFPIAGSGGTWDGSVIATPAIVDDELVGLVTTPSAGSIEISFELQGLTT